jgi:hypothetical protein
MPNAERKRSERKYHRLVNRMRLAKARKTGVDIIRSVAREKSIHPESIVDQSPTPITKHQHTH